MIPRRNISYLGESNLNELSNLSRLYFHILNHDCAIITAFKYNLEYCVGKCEFPVDHIITKNENKGRNSELNFTLVELGYGVTSIDGSWIEGYGTAFEKEYKEDSLFVVNVEDKPDFITRIVNLGKFYCQDAVLIKEKGVDDAYLYGTNNHPYSNSLPDLDQKKSIGIFKGGETGQLMSHIRNRPFRFFIREQLDLTSRGYGTYPTSQKVLKQVEEMLEFLKGKDSV